MRYLTLIAALTGTTILAGCGEAGIDRHNASWALATQNNHLVQSAEYQRGDFLREVRAQFAADTPDRVTFAFDRSSLDAAARRTLDAQAKWLRENPNVRVRIAGHTDLVGGESYNDRLGLRRARAAARYLLRRGVARGRIDTVESLGESQPVVDTESRERQNRRTVTQVAGFTHGFVGEGMDGRRALLMYQRYVSDTVEKPSVGTTTSPGGS
ncbi:MAG: OmpA family protein [Pseudomonadota bacterium]